MSQRVAIVINLRDDHQSHHFEIYIRDMFPNDVISYSNLPNTEKLWEDDNHFKKLVKNVKTAQLARDEYINNKN